MVVARIVRGFTLVELVVAVAIVALLASVAVPFTELGVQRAKEHDLRRALREIRDAIDAYKQAYDDGRIQKAVGDTGYPKRIEDLVAGIADQQRPGRDKIIFLRRIPRDPFAADAGGTAAETWGRRSYASPPDEPAEGTDVFDVYSRAPGTGIDGRPYRRW